MKKTYSETEGDKPFDWFQALNQPKISDEEWEQLDNLATSWVTCACGNQCSIIPRDEYGAPQDGELKQLGNIFSLHIEKRNVKSAISVLKHIEERSIQVIKNVLQGYRDILEEYKDFDHV